MTRRLPTAQPVRARSPRGLGPSDPIGPTNYAVTPPDGNANSDGIGIGGGIGTAPDGYDGHVTFYVQVSDVGAALEKAEGLGGTRMMGPDEMPEVGITIGLFSDPEGHVIGVVRTL